MLYTRNFISIVLTDVLSNIAFSFYTMALTYYVYNLTGSVFFSSLITFLSVASRFTAGLTISIITSLLSSRMLLIMSSLSQIVLITLLALIVLSKSSVTLIILYIIVILISYINGIFNPIKSKIIKNILHADVLTKGLSVLSSVNQVLMLSSWVAGGFIISLIGESRLLWLTLALLIMALICNLILDYKDDKDILTSSNPLRVIAASFHYLRGHQLVFILIIIECLETLIGSIWIGSITLPFVTDFLHQDTKWWGYINASYYLGTMLGALITIRISAFLKKDVVRYIIIGMLVYGSLLICYSFNTSPPLSLFIVLLIGPVLQIKDIIQESYILTVLDDDYVTAILGVKGSFVQLSFMLSLVIIGVIGEVIAIQYVYTLAGIAVIFISLFFAYHTKNKAII